MAVNDRVDSLCLVETRSIACGALALDSMMKAANVYIIRASTICSGRFLIILSGNRQDVDTAYSAAQREEFQLHYSCTVGNVAPSVIGAIQQKGSWLGSHALGLVECKAVAPAIAAADAAVKKADVQLLRLSMGQGINGKSYFVLGGDVASVEDALQAAKEKLGKALVNAIILPNPDKAAAKALV